MLIIFHAHAFHLKRSSSRFAASARFSETSCSQRSDGVQPSQERLVYQPLWGAQDSPCVGDVCVLYPIYARLHSHLSGVSDHNVSFCVATEKSVE